MDRTIDLKEEHHLIAWLLTELPTFVDIFILDIYLGYAVLYLAFEDHD